MPLTEAEELELLELEEEEYQDSLLIANSGKTEESPVPEKEEDEKTFLANRKPSQVAGDVFKGLTSSLTSGLPDVPYIAKQAYGAVKGIAGAAGNMFKKENYKNTINDPLGAAKGAAQGLGNTALGIGFGTLAEAPALRQMKYDRTGNPDIEYIPPKMLTPKTEGEKAGSNLASSAAILGATALSAKPIAKSLVKKLSSPELAGSVKETANRLQNRTTKILSKEADSGAKLENIGKHGLFGKNDIALKKGKGLVDDWYTQLKNKLQENNSPDNYKNLDEALTLAEQRALSVTKEGRGAVVDAFKNIREDYFGSEKASGLFKDKIIDLADAQMLKQDVGTRAEWHHLPYNAKADNAKGAAYKAIQGVLKEALEDAGGPEIKELNKKMSEVIPINTANAKRILVSQRSNPIPLDDFVGYLTSAASFAHGNPLPALLTAGNKIIKSPDFARRLYELGDKLEPPRIEPKYAIEKGLIDLPQGYNIPAYRRKNVSLAERGNRTMTPGEDRHLQIKKDWEGRTIPDAIMIKEIERQLELKKKQAQLYTGKAAK